MKVTAEYISSMSLRRKRQSTDSRACPYTPRPYPTSSPLPLRCLGMTCAGHEQTNGQKSIQ